MNLLMFILSFLSPPIFFSNEHGWVEQPVMMSALPALGFLKSFMGADIQCGVSPFFYVPDTFLALQALVASMPVVIQPSLETLPSQDQAFLGSGS
jgi:hypothetical protein